ncbi:HIRAN domain-containing protein [Rhizobium viscosum]|uniref:HIRAN domain-containing protein n=1 Tax=Rhizobium viscosum TaxID=1673 RepID=A0ABR9IT80_RHIVS|nr:HIRAN domain-containing protein [Rhizobium viscosum]MBE1506398.1 hypothetical protein [Rhizobium viscosum]
MMRAFFLTWQDPDTRRWLPVAKLVNIDNNYIFGYTEGARISDAFVPFEGMRDLSSLYVSADLFPIFANRVMNERRPEYSRYLEWAGLKKDTDPLGLMARIGGIRATDGFQVFPVPEKGTDGKFRSVFFSHGISHLPSMAAERVVSLKHGDSLYPMHDVLNPFDPNAVCLRTADPVVIVGYCPRYISPDVKVLSDNPSLEMTIAVKQVNHDAPAQFRLLCEAACSWPEQFVPCSSPEHELISALKVEEVLSALDSSKSFQRATG